MSKPTDTEYRDSMDGPMECLAMELADLLPDGLDDHEIVTRTITIVEKMRNLLMLSGKYTAEELKVILS